MVKNKIDFPNYPEVNKKNFKSWNDDMFLKYNNERVYKHPNLIIRYIERKRVEALIQFLGRIKRSDKILAAGCGEGYIEKKINKGKLFLVDISPHAVERAKRGLHDLKNIKYFVADLEKLPFPDGYFDKIECSEVIEHVLSPEKMLIEFKRVLKSDGILVVSFPNEPLINFLKSALLKIGILHLVFPNIPDNMLEEWHLRSMDLTTFKNFTKTDWKIKSFAAAPNKLLPIRYVVLCEKKVTHF